jgi:23S rRNA U2552 (ribose-2'-O)-methylase RlmE/FtsJ
VKLSPSRAHTPGPRAPPVLGVDVGACPGGWTLALALRGARVLAVDPGSLSIKHPHVTHAPHRIESRECADAFARWAATAADCNSGGAGASGSVSSPFLDVAVCDVNMGVEATCKVMVAALTGAAIAPGREPAEHATAACGVQRLRPGGVLVLTVKAFSKHTAEGDIALAARILSPWFDAVEGMWLMSNRCERTLIAVRSATRGWEDR